METAELYEGEIAVKSTIEKEVTMRGSLRAFRGFLIALFENCSALQREEQVASSILFL